MAGADGGGKDESIGTRLAQECDVLGVPLHEQSAPTETKLEVASVGGEAVVRTNLEKRAAIESLWHSSHRAKGCAHVRRPHERVNKLRLLGVRHKADPEQRDQRKGFLAKGGGARDAAHFIRRLARFVWEEAPWTPMSGPARGVGRHAALLPWIERERDRAAFTRRRCTAWRVDGGVRAPMKRPECAHVLGRGEARRADADLTGPSAVVQHNSFRREAYITRNAPHYAVICVTAF